MKRRRRELARLLASPRLLCRISRRGRAAITSNSADSINFRSFSESFINGIQPCGIHSTSRNFGDLYGDLPAIKARCSEIFRYTENSANLLKASLSFFARLAIFGNYSIAAKNRGCVIPPLQRAYFVPAYTCSAFSRGRFTHKRIL